MTIPSHRLIGGAAWLLAAISTLLFVASMTGEGTGLFRLGVLTAPWWSWIFLALISAGIFSILTLATRPKEGYQS